MPHGEVELKQFNITDGPHGNYNLQQLQASLYNCSNNKQQFSINSDFIDAKITGQLTPKKIQNGIQCIINKCAPLSLSLPIKSMLLDRVLHVPAFTSAEQIAYTIALFKHIKNFRDENIALQPIYPLLMEN